jgi:hypothetical protein
MAHHLSKLNLTGLIEGQDLTYDISCKLSPDVPNPDSVKSCEYNGTIARKKIEVYLPETGDVAAKVDTVVPAPVALPFLFGLFWFRRKPKKGAWGLVYDRANRKPIPFAVVRLYDTISNRVIKEEVTSIDGKYNFLVGAGAYTLVAEHSLYTASQRELKLTGDKGEIAEEMPLIKRSSKVTVRPRGIWPMLKIVLIKYNNYIVLVGFIFSAIATFLTPMWYNFIVLALYVIQEIILLLNSGIKWARVIDKDSHEPIPGAFVRLFDLVEKRQIEVTLTDNLGRYKFLTKDGQYLAVAYQTGYVMASSLDEVEGAVQKFMKITIKRGITKDDIYLKRLTQ